MNQTILDKYGLTWKNMPAFPNKKMIEMFKDDEKFDKFCKNISDALKNKI